MSSLNYRHLYYFWVVAKEGGMSRAAQRLDVAIQTVSAQVRELEKSLGHQLLKPEGRGLALTEAGQAAYWRAEEIFQIGQRIPGEVADAFEVPLAFLMNPAHHRRHTVDVMGRPREFFSMPWGEGDAERFIWGATAGMLRNLYRFLVA